MQDLESHPNASGRDFTTSWRKSDVEERTIERSILIQESDYGDETFLNLLDKDGRQSPDGEIPPSI